MKGDARCWGIAFSFLPQKRVYIKKLFRQQALECNIRLANE